MDEINAVLAACLEDAAAILRRHFAALAAGDVVAKGRSFDIQTIADTASENAIVERIRRAFPDHAILSEETGAAGAREARVRWIVDPIDGTLNYRHGFPYCAISIAIEVDGIAALAAVYNPFREELYRAERGRGATLNGAPIRVSAVASLGESLVVAGLPYDRRERIDHYLRQIRRFIMEAQGVLRLGSAALDLCAVAAGRVEGYFEEYIRVWDWAAGRLIVEEAGGKVTDYRGGDPGPDKRQVCASNGLVHEQMLALLGPTIA